VLDVRTGRNPLRLWNGNETEAPPTSTYSSVFAQRLIVNCVLVFIAAPPHTHTKTTPTPKMDRLDVAGGLNPGSSEPGNLLLLIWTRDTVRIHRQSISAMEEIAPVVWYLLVFYALPKDRVSLHYFRKVKAYRNILYGLLTTICVKIQSK
jgi:hypothetical protein